MSLNELYVGISDFFLFHILAEKSTFSTTFNRTQLFYIFHQNRVVTIMSSLPDILWLIDVL